jgi:hypothetical protein
MQRKLFGGLGIILLALSLFTGVALGQQSWLELRNDVNIFGRLFVQETSRFYGDVELEDSLTVADDLTVTDNLAVGGQLQQNVGGPTTVTNGGSIDCSDGGLHLLTAAGTVGTATVVTTSVEGVECIFLNEAAQTITLTDTGVLLLAGNAALTQYDTLCLVSANSVWHQTCKNAN